MSRQRAKPWLGIHLILLVCASLCDDDCPYDRRPRGHATGPFRRGKSGRIINGTEVKPPYKYPYLGMMWWNGCFEPEKCCYQYAGPGCGVTVIDKYWLVTAAHCCVSDNVTDVYGVTIVFGIHNWSSIEPWTQNLTIAECIPHELYV